MLIFIEYSFTGKSARICYDISGYSLQEAKVLIPEWLKSDNIQYDSYNIYEILQSLMTEDV